MKFARQLITPGIVFALSGLALGAAAQTSTQALPDAPSTTAQEAPAAVPTGPTVIFDTTMGRLTCKLFSKEAPKTVDNFIGLATGSKTWTDATTQQKVTGKPFYDGTTFHRVIPQFMIQGGDRLGTGMGDAGYFFEDEFSPALRFDVPGRLAMANSGPNTNGSQFFITEAPVPQLNGKHTIFGQCDAHSVLIVASIARVERDHDDKPVTPVVVNKVTIVPEGQPIPPDPMASSAPATPTNASPQSAPATNNQQSR
ncbi:MAG TPA: peptidylprolyl isomerase [Acidobacteriaceae bacterium]|nr:peptidylprolyl isomerase [Acidobacteriaceae bacterium]